MQDTVTEVETTLDLRYQSVAWDMDTQVPHLSAPDSGSPLHRGASHPRHTKPRPAVALKLAPA